MLWPLPVTCTAAWILVSIWGRSCAKAACTELLTIVCRVAMAAAGEVETVGLGADTVLVVAVAKLDTTAVVAGEEDAVTMLDGDAIV